MIGCVDARNAGAYDQHIEVLDSHAWLPFAASAGSMRAGARGDKQMSAQGGTTAPADNGCDETGLAPDAAPNPRVATLGIADRQDGRRNAGYGEGHPCRARPARAPRHGRAARPSCDALIVNVADPIMIGSVEAKCARFRSPPSP